MNVACMIIITPRNLFIFFILSCSKNICKMGIYAFEREDKFICKYIYISSLLEAVSGIGYLELYCCV